MRTREKAGAQNTSKREIAISQKENLRAIAKSTGGMKSREKMYQNKMAIIARAMNGATSGPIA
jgi:hypothetical protein